MRRLQSGEAGTGRNVSVGTVLGVPGGVPFLESVTAHNHPCVPHVNLGLRRVMDIVSPGNMGKTKYCYRRFPFLYGNHDPKGKPSVDHHCLHENQQQTSRKQYTGRVGGILLLMMDGHPRACRLRGDSTYYLRIFL